VRGGGGRIRQGRGVVEEWPFRASGQGKTYKPSQGHRLASPEAARAARRTLAESHRPPAGQAKVEEGKMRGSEGQRNNATQYTMETPIVPHSSLSTTPSEVPA